MALAPRPTFVVLAGPNGSGKSTLYSTRIAPRLAVPFINADIIQADELANTDMQAAYEAARIASERRAKHLSARTSFATETVFSHPSKLELIKKAKDIGYRVLLLHISVENPNLSVARVAERVEAGGHRVPENKIRERYDRTGPLIRHAVLHSDVGHIYDNSKLNKPPERIMSFADGKLSFVVQQLPEWALKIYHKDLMSRWQP